MAFFLRSLSRAHCTTLPSLFLATRKTLPWLHHMAFIKNHPTSLFGRCSIQQRSLHPLTQKALYVLTGIRPLTPEEKKQIFDKRQKIWVAHFSANAHEATERHWQMFYHLNDLPIAKDYLNLLKKDKRALSPEEALALVNLYEFALAESPDFFMRKGLYRKQAEYQAVVDSM
jgi:hypothetical protein